VKSSGSFFSIRPMRRKDAAVVVRMIHEINDHKKQTKKFIEQACFGAAKFYRGWVAVDKDAVIAVVLTSEKPSLNVPTIDYNVDFLFVNKNWRSRKIGEALMVHVAQDAAKRGCGWFRTQTNPGFKRAQHFYRNIGLTQRTYRPILFFTEGSGLQTLTKKKV
jgi:GNAT superfamily N-acetyltransferase